MALTCSAAAQSNPLVLDVIVEDETFTVNGEITFFITITNRSSVLLSDVQLVANLPADAEWPGKLEERINQAR